MNKQLERTGVKKLSEAPLILEFDEFVPLRFRSYHTPLGSGYLRLGDYPASLAELIVEPYSQVVRGLTVVWYQNVAPWPRLSIASSKQGLPVLSTNFETYQNEDLQVDFQVAVKDHEILVYWGALGNVESCDFAGPDRGVRFLVREGQLAAAWFVGLSLEETCSFSSLAGSVQGWSDPAPKHGINSYIRECAMRAETVAFVGALVHHCPALMPVLEEHLQFLNGEVLPHVLFGDVTRWVVELLRVAGKNDRTLRGILDFMEQGLDRGESDVQELIAASFLENLPSPGESGWEIRSLLGPLLQEELRRMSQ